MHPTRRLPRLLCLLLIGVLPLVAAGCGADDEPTARPTTSDEVRDLAGDPPDGPGVVPGVGIAGVEVGMVRADVEALLGPPDAEESAPNEFSGQDDPVLRWHDPAIEVTFGSGEAGDEVRRVETTSADLRTSSGDDGIGVGSSIDDVRAAHPDAECIDDAVAICRLGGGSEPGEIATDLFLDDDRVTRIVVTRVID